MIERRFGEHDVFLSVVGFGGICVAGRTSADARRMVDGALERGINYFDVAPSYGDAEELLGEALEEHRSRVFLAGKTAVREADGAEREFRATERKLRSDYLDLYQLHGIESEEEVDRILAPGGALELLERLRAAGEVRFLGFSAHSEDAALRLLDAFHFDSVMFPINWRSWYAGGIGARLIDRARVRGTAVIALKALADRRLREGEPRPYERLWYKPVSSYEEAELALRFTLSKSVTAAISPGHEELLWWACDAATGLAHLTDEEDRELRSRASGDTPVFTRTLTRIQARS